MANLDRLKNAVGKRSVANDPSPNAVSNAANTSLGRGTRSTTISRDATQAATSSRSRARGSWEGLQHAPSARIQMNGSGYQNPSMQTARGRKPPARLSQPNKNPVFDVGRINRSSFDYRTCRTAGNSVARLNEARALHNLL